MRAAAAPAAALLLLAACTQSGGAEPKRDKAGFPQADRPVAAIVSDKWENEGARDRLGEAKAVMDAARVVPGMTVADIGAGEGYYTVRLAARVGRGGRVLAEDVVPDYRDQLAERVSREALDNVSVRLGLPGDPRLPAGSFDRIFMIHMYHEITEPYAFLWNLRPALKPGGQIAIVDADRPTGSHGTPPALLDCELAAVGFKPVGHTALRDSGAYLSLYAAEGPQPDPRAIMPCSAQNH